MQSVRDIALDMGRAEREADIPTLDRYLHDDLVFRRAGGSIVDKATFLAGVVGMANRRARCSEDSRVRRDMRASAG